MKIEFDEDTRPHTLRGIKLMIDSILDHQNKVIPDNVAKAVGGSGVLPAPISLPLRTSVPAPPTKVVEVTVDAVVEATVERGIEIGETDAAGVPWDGRIHAGGKTTTSTGIWKRRRGVDKETHAKVTAELMAGFMTAPVSMEITDIPPPPSVPAPPVTDVSTPGFSNTDWQQVVQRLMTGKVAEKVTQEEANAKAVELGVDGGFNNLASRPDLFDRFLIELSL